MIVLRPDEDYYRVHKTQEGNPRLGDYTNTLSIVITKSKKITVLCLVFLDAANIQCIDGN